MGDFNLSFKVFINLFQQILMSVAAYEVRQAYPQIKLFFMFSRYGTKN